MSSDISLAGLPSFCFLTMMFTLSADSAAMAACSVIRLISNLATANRRCLVFHMFTEPDLEIVRAYGERDKTLTNMGFSAVIFDLSGQTASCTCGGKKDRVRSSGTLNVG